MSRYHTEQERIDSMTMQIVNSSDVVGSGFVRYPPQRPAMGKQRPAPTSPNFQGGFGGGRQGQQVRQQPPMPRPMGSFGPPQVQNLHQFNPSPASSQQRFHHQNSSHSAGGPMPLSHQGGFAPRMSGIAGGYRPQDMGPPQAGMYQHQMAHSGMGGYRPEGGPPYQNGLGMMGRPMGPGMAPHGMSSGMMPRPGYQLPHPMQSMPQGGGIPRSIYMEQGLEQGLQPDYQSRAMDNGLVERPQNYQAQGPVYAPIALAPATSGHMAQQFLGTENDNKQRFLQQQQQQQQQAVHVRIPQISGESAAMDLDGSRSPAVNYQPPPPHKAPAPIGTPLPGSLTTKASPPKPGPSKPAPGAPVSRPVQASRPAQMTSSQAMHRPGPAKPVQAAVSRPVQQAPADKVARKPKVVEASVRQDPKVGVPAEREEDAGETGPSLNGEGKETLTKRQKTRLRKKLREQHLKKQPAANALKSA